MPVGAPRLGRLVLDSDARLFYVIFTAVVAGVAFARNLFRTRVGQQLSARSLSDPGVASLR